MTTLNENHKNEDHSKTMISSSSESTIGHRDTLPSSPTPSVFTRPRSNSFPESDSNATPSSPSSTASPSNLGSQIQSAFTPVTQAFARLSTMASESSLVSGFQSLKSSSATNTTNKQPPFWKRKGKVPGTVKPVKGPFSPKMEKPHGFMARPPTPPKMDSDQNDLSSGDYTSPSLPSSPHSPVPHMFDHQSVESPNGVNHHHPDFPKSDGEYEHHCQSFKACGTPTERQSRLGKFQKILGEPVVDLEALRKISWKGIPFEVRPMTWKFLLGYLPANVDRRESTLERKRKEYWDCIPQYFDINDEDRPKNEQEMFRQIQIDVPRTNPNVALFQQPVVQEILKRILYVWAIRHPASGYVQGINDLATPFFVVFLAGIVDDVDSCDVSKVQSSLLSPMEADCYWCMSKLLDGIQDHYTFAQPGIQRMTFKLKELIGRIDAPLSRHLEQQNAEFIQFAFRWMNCFLMREMPLALIVRMWDTYLAEGPSEGFSVFHVYVCAAFLVMWSEELRQREFQDIMLFLQHLPTQTWQCKDIELLASQAYMWMTIFQNAPSHLKS